MNEQSQFRDRIAQEAADWFVRNRAKEVSTQERAAFGEWLRSSPLHVEEYLKTAVVSRDLHAAIGAWDTDIGALLSAPRTDDNVTALSFSQRNHSRNNEARPGKRHSFWRVGAIAAASILALVGGAWLDRDGQRFGLPRQFVTVHAEQGSWLLPDGTSMSLNSDSAVTVRYNGRERLVTVERGQALFQVAHESARRFRVIAGDTGVIAVGTEFDVFRMANSTRVTVAEGKVAVFSGEAPKATAGQRLPAQISAVGAGEQIQINDYSRPAAPMAVNVQQALAWVQRQVIFNEQPLGEVATEFNRYGAVPIVIQDDKLRQLPISGVFNAYDTDSFVAFMARLDRVEVERSAQRILIRTVAN